MKKRVIPTLQIDNRKLVKTIKMGSPVYLGDPINAVRIFSDMSASEILINDISASKSKIIDYEYLRKLCNEAYVPMSYCGGISSFNDAEKLFRLGFEKVAIETLNFLNPNEAKKIADVYGSSSLVGTLSVTSSHMVKPWNQKKLFKKSYSLVEAVSTLLDNKCGEIVIHCTYNEGCYSGVDEVLLSKLPKELDIIPCIYMGGVGHKSQIESLLDSKMFSGVGIGSLAVFSGKRRGIMINYPSI